MPRRSDDRPAYSESTIEERINSAVRAMLDRRKKSTGETHAELAMLANISESALSNYLSNEHPSQIPAHKLVHVARVCGSTAPIEAMCALQGGTFQPVEGVACGGVDLLFGQLADLAQVRGDMMNQILGDLQNGEVNQPREALDAIRKCQVRLNEIWQAVLDLAENNNNITSFEAKSLAEAEQLSKDQAIHE